MLALLAAEGTRLDAGSVGLALSRRWSDAGDAVLFVDADTSGSRLAERFGEAVRAEYSPAVRGMASLIVAREPLTLRLLADHCYSLDTSDGALWALFAPHHPAGAQHAARWLAERADDLTAVDRERSVIVSASLRDAADSLEPLLRVVPVVVVLAAVESADAAKALWTLCRDAGLMGFARRNRLLIVEGSSPLGDEAIHAESGLRVAGRLPVLDDDRILRLQGGRRERAFAAVLDKIAARVSALMALDTAASGPAATGETAADSGDTDAGETGAGEADAAARLGALHGRGPSGVNGGATVPGRRSGELFEPSEGRV